MHDETEMKPLLEPRVSIAAQYSVGNPKAKVSIINSFFLQACRAIGTKLMVGVLGFCLLSSQVNAQKLNELPTLGDTASGTVSPELEHRLGRAWLKMLRARTDVVDDPLINDYLKYLVFSLAEHSQLKDRRLEFVIVNAPELNAFAVPGGIIGVNAGLFTYAQTEQEFAAVIAHELAHLSQRHYSRGVEQAKRNQIPSMAALLASVVIAATVGGDAGIAAMSATQAALLDSKLRFSRQNEREADRIGLQTMVAAGMDPGQMAAMFERMLASQRLAGSRPPEFLLSHPVTESRVADARNRAKQFPKGNYRDNLEYYLMRSRIALSLAPNPTVAINRFKDDLDNPNEVLRKAAYYGLALAYSRDRQGDRANETLQKLIDSDPSRISYVVAAAEINHQPRQLPKAERLLRRHLLLSPDNYPLSYQLSKNLTRQKRFKEATQLLTQMSADHPNNPLVWHDLAEVAGLEGDIIAVHRARAEYFMLTGRLDSALKQLEFAQKKAVGNYQLITRIDQRIIDARKLKRALENF